MEKTVVLIIIGGTLLFSLSSWVTAPEIKDVVRFVLTCALCYFLYSGKNWARLVLGALLGVGAASGAYVIINIPLPVQAVAFIGAMAAFYATSSILLISGKIVGTYFGKHAA